MKKKVLDEINNFVNILYTMFKLGAGDFAKKNFPAIVEDRWDDSKSDKENLECIKAAFKLEKKLQESADHQAIVQLIEAFEDGWLNKIECK